MAEKNEFAFHGVEVKYPLTQKAEKELEALAPFLSERLVGELDGFLRGLRQELQDDEALALGYMTEALRLIPKDMSVVKTTMFGFFLRIKEQILDNAGGGKG